MALRTGDRIPVPEFHNMPGELKQMNRWLLWKAVPRKDKPNEATKVPVKIDGSDFYGWNTPSNLYNFYDVEQAFQTGRFDGVGFALAETDLICIDLDNDVSTTNISRELEDLTNLGYTEISPSGKGYHVWLKGIKPEGMGKNGYTEAGEKLEVFGGSGWVTMTGRVYNDAPIEYDQQLINDLYKSYFKEQQSQQAKEWKSGAPSVDMTGMDGDILKVMFNSRSGKEIRALWNGDTSPYNGDDSAADLALCDQLAFYAKGDQKTIDRLFRQSALYRSKWDERRGKTTYGEMTINKALLGRSNTDFYSGNYGLSSPNEYVAKDIPPLNQKNPEELKTEYLQNSTANHLQGFINGIAESVDTPYIPTGFNKLDEVLDGGLYEGLYIVGAISSLGKTTLVTQIGDQVAASGTDVLIFSLEMARTEIMAKSISRLTLINTLENKGNIAHAKTARGITTGKRYANYSVEERRLIVDSINNYKSYAERIYIVEGIGDIGVQEVRETVKQHIELTGNLPLVIVDYVQLLAPYNERATDKQNTDKAILELKRISRDYKIPVFGISSFNRQNYNQSVSMEAFKESGAIEYSSDVLIGLQAKGAGESGFDVNKAKQKNPREIELKILKNRNGRTGDVVAYEYYTLFNYFKEGGSRSHNNSERGTASPKVR